MCIELSAWLKTVAVESEARHRRVREVEQSVCRQHMLEPVALVARNQRAQIRLKASGIIGRDLLKSHVKAPVCVGHELAALD